MLKKLFVVAVMLISSLGVSQAYPGENGVHVPYVESSVTAAGADEAKLAAIASDAPDTTWQVRSKALGNLSEPKISELLDGFNDDYQTMTFIRNYLVGIKKLPDDQRGIYAIISSVTNNEYVGAAVMRETIREFLDKGKIDEAVIEARRLYAMTPATTTELNYSIAVIAGIVKAKAIKDGKSLKESISIMNTFLKDVQDGKSSQNPFSLIPIPAGPKNISDLESGKDLRSDARIVLLSLLYQGKWDAADSKADTFLASASSDQMAFAISLKARSINGRAGSPTAANDFIASLN